MKHHLIWFVAAWVGSAAVFAGAQDVPDEGEAVAAEPQGAAEEEVSLSSGFKMVGKTSTANTYKALALNLTPQARLSKLRVGLEMFEQKVKGGEYSSESTTTYSTSKYREGKSRVIFHVSIRGGNTGDSVNGAQMVVQYFTRALQGNTGKVEALEALKVSTPLPKLTVRSVMIECPPFMYENSISTYRSAYSHYSSTTKRGDDFYGAIVSIFDATGKLIYQGASGRSIEKMGVSEP